MRDRGAALHAIYLLIQVAKFQYRGGDRLGARRSLIEALRLAAPGGFRRSLLDGDVEIAEIVREIHLTRPGPELCSVKYLAVLYADFRIESGTSQRATPILSSIEPDEATHLSAKEIEVLKLSAAHLVAREIAQRKGVAESTVKW